MKFINKLKSISKIQIAAIVLILVGLFITIHYAIGTFNAYRAMEFARQNNFEAGNPDPNLIRPWMNLRYIAVAYTVPQEYLFFELGIPMERRFSETPLYHLNDQFEFGRSTETDRPYPRIIDMLQTAILKYRENPVTTGLREGGVRPWMSVQYIANSTGIPADYIFEQLGIPMDDRAFMLLDRLADDVKYEGGLRELVRDMQRVVDTYEAPE